MKLFNRILFSYVIGVCFLIIFTFSFMIPVSAINTTQTVESKENMSEAIDLSESQEIEDLVEQQLNNQGENTNSVKDKDKEIKAPLLLIDIDEDISYISPKIAPKGMHRTTKGKVTSSIPNSKLNMAESQNTFDMRNKFFRPLSIRGTYSGDPYVEYWEIKKDNTTIKDGDTMYYNESYTLTYEWELPNDEFRDGDVLIFSIPKEFVVDDIFDFNVPAPNGETVGQARVRGNNENGYRIEMTLNDYIESNSFVAGFFELQFHLNETYVMGGTNVVELPGSDLTVNFPDPPETGGGGGGGDGSGSTDYNKLHKAGAVTKDSEHGNYISWSIILGRDALLGQKNEDGTITPKFNSFDDIQHIYIEDNPTNQKLIPYESVGGWSGSYGWFKTFWKSHPFDYGRIPKEEMGLIGPGPDYYSFKADIIDRIKTQENKYSDEGFTYYEFWYYTEPLDRFEEAELDNEATVTIVGKNGEEIEYTLVDSVQWNTGSGGAVGKKGSVELEKYDDKTNERLEDAVFDLYKKNPNGADKLINYNLVTNSQGKIVVSGLTAGDYYFVETTPPPGYELSDKEWEFSITRDNINEGQYVQIDIPNTHIADRDFDLIKRDESTGFTIGSGAVFELERYDAPNWVRANNEKYTTDSNGRISLDESDFEKLESPAWYRFKEIKAPYGYEMPNDPYTDRFYVDNYSVEPDEINKTNRKLNHKMSLQKTVEFNTSTNSPTRVEGIEFVLQGRSNGDWNRFTQEVFITDSNGIIQIDNKSHSGLIDAMVDSPYKQFRFREYSIPPGRGLQDPQYPNSDTERVGNPGDKFSVEIPIQQFRDGTNNGQSVTISPLKLENKLIRYNISFTKMDSVNKDRLNGAEFTMTEKGKPGTAVTSKGNNGVFDFNDLIINREYEIKETKAPEGYGARSDTYVIRLDLNERMHVTRVSENGQSANLVEGKDFTWNNGTLKLNFDVENTAMPKMPMTGGIGMTIYGTIGTLLMGMGFILYKYIENKDKRSE